MFIRPTEPQSYPRTFTHRHRVPTHHSRAVEHSIEPSCQVCLSSHHLLRRVIHHGEGTELWVLLTQASVRLNRPPSTVLVGHHNYHNHHSTQLTTTSLWRLNTVPHA